MYVGERERELWDDGTSEGHTALKGQAHQLTLWRRRPHMWSLQYWRKFMELKGLSVSCEKDFG